MHTMIITLWQCVYHWPYHSYEISTGIPHLFKCCMIHVHMMYVLVHLPGSPTLGYVPTAKARRHRIIEVIVTVAVDIFMILPCDVGWVSCWKYPNLKYQAWKHSLLSLNVNLCPLLEHKRNSHSSTHTEVNTNCVCKQSKQYALSFWW